MNKTINFFSKHDFLLAVLFFSGVFAIIFFPVLFQHKIFKLFLNMSIPLHGFVGESLKCCNTIPTWFSGYMGGFPVYLTQGIGFLHPLAIIFFKFFETTTAFNSMIIAGFFGAGIFFYLLGKEFSWPVSSCLVAGLVYIFNGLHIQWGTQITFNNFFSFCPLVFFLILRIHKQYRRWHLFILAAVLSIGLLGAFTEIVFVPYSDGVFFLNLS